MRKGGELRGNNKDRRRRKEWLLATFDPEMGRDQCRCHLMLSDRCTTLLNYDTVTADRIVLGSSYAREGLRPSCATCQHTQGGLAAAGRLGAVV